MKKKLERHDGGFFEWQKQDSDIKCKCGCGKFISNRSAKKVLKGDPACGYCKGHTWKNKTLPESAKQKMRDNHADFSGEKNPNFGHGLFGESNPNWQGGKTERYIKGNHPGANTKQDIEFRKKIKERDGACVLCGNKSRLEMHHIKSWIDFEELRFEELNCITLCKSCHVRADNTHHKERIRPMLLAYIASLEATK